MLGPAWLRGGSACVVVAATWACCFSWHLQCAEVAKFPGPTACLTLLERDGKVGQLMQALASPTTLMPREQVLSAEAVVA